MKTTTTDLRAHLDQEVTAMCTCWIIERVDGTVLRFTDADLDVTQGGDTYKSIGAYQRTAIESTSSLAVDNLDIVGSSSDLALPEEDLRAGLFDNAQITVFMTPWLDAVRGRLKLRRGFFGEVQMIPNGTYQVELRGLLQRLSYNYTDIFSPSCLYDLGQAECGVNIKGADLDVGTSFAVGDGARVAQDAYKRGKLYDIGWTDPDFEEAGALGGVTKSPYWYNSGANDLITATDERYTGTYALRGNSGAGTARQDIDLEADTALPVTDLDAEACYLTMRAFRRDNGDEGRFRVQFLDRDGDVLGYGQQLTLAAGFNITQINLAADFTLELWLKLETTPDINDAIFGQGAFGGSGTTGNRFAFENGTLSFRMDDDTFGSGGQIILQSPLTPTQNEWRHVALVRSGTTLSLYENFIETDSVTYTGTIKIAEWAKASGSSGFVGEWDELRLWDVARSGLEMALDGRHTIDPATANLIRYYSFDDTNGADLTGNDAFDFGPGPNLQTGHGSPVAVLSAHAYALGDANWGTGYQDVGTTWTEVGVQDHLIPANARIMRVSFDVNPVSATPVDARIDNLTGHIINVNEDGPVIGYMTNDVAWRCTTAGTPNDNQATGGVGNTITVGGPQFVGENAWLRGARVLSVSDNRTFVVEVSDARAVDAWFNEGAVIFESGANAGAAMEIKSWDAATRQIELFLSMPNQIKAGDYLSVYPGCDKSRIVCAAIFNNVANMYATPDVPGQDELFRYPDPT